MFQSHHHKWSREENTNRLLCYYASLPEQRGYRGRMCEKWREHYPECQRSEQNLADQVKSVLRRKVFTDVELESFKRKSLSEDNTV